MPRNRSAIRLRHRPGVIQGPGRFVFRLPYGRPPITANQRTHWAVRAREVRTLRNTTAVLAHGLAPIETACTIGIVWHVPDRRRRDVDNIAPSLKPAIDGLRDAGLIPEDHSSIVTATWQRIEQSDGWGVEIHLEEA